ncbi:hypothetical protein C1H46_020477 [Malus baccata]|uniref:Uncharacterized protein n=1 Tax=Malus baccata TaxID=106549 RepID=A0A540M5E2_MALBA|nr:hypothetical protein C1H46_020477 [Malus baccata]
MVVGQDKDVANAFILQETVANVERQGTREGRDVSELLEDLKGNRASSNSEDSGNYSGDIKV